MDNAEEPTKKEVEKQQTEAASSSLADSVYGNQGKPASPAINPTEAPSSGATTPGDSKLPTVSGKKPSDSGSPLESGETNDSDHRPTIQVESDLSNPQNRLKNSARPSGTSAVPQLELKNAPSPSASSEDLTITPLPMHKNSDGNVGTKTSTASLSDLVSGTVAQGISGVAHAAASGAGDYVEQKRPSASQDSSINSILPVAQEIKHGSSGSDISGNSPLKQISYGEVNSKGDFTPVNKDFNPSGTANAAARMSEAIANSYSDGSKNYYDMKPNYSDQSKLNYYDKISANSEKTNYSDSIYVDKKGTISDLVNNTSMNAYATKYGDAGSLSGSSYAKQIEHNMDSVRPLSTQIAEGAAAPYKNFGSDLARGMDSGVRGAINSESISRSLMNDRQNFDVNGGKILDSSGGSLQKIIQGDSSAVAAAGRDLNPSTSRQVADMINAPLPQHQSQSLDKPQTPSGGNGSPEAGPHNTPAAQPSIRPESHDSSTNTSVNRPSSPSESAPPQHRDTPTQTTSTPVKPETSNQPAARPETTTPRPEPTQNPRTESPKPETTTRPAENGGTGPRPADAASGGKVEPQKAEGNRPESQQGGAKPPENLQRTTANPDSSPAALKDLLKKEYPFAVGSPEPAKAAPKSDAPVAPPPVPSSQQLNRDAQQQQKIDAAQPLPGKVSVDVTSPQKVTGPVSLSDAAAGGGQKTAQPIDMKPTSAQPIDVKSLTPQAQAIDLKTQAQAIDLKAQAQTTAQSIDAKTASAINAANANAVRVDAASILANGGKGQSPLVTPGGRGDILPGGPGAIPGKPGSIANGLGPLSAGRGGEAAALNGRILTGRSLVNDANGGKRFLTGVEIGLLIAAVGIAKNRLDAKNGKLDGDERTSKELISDLVRASRQFALADAARRFPGRELTLSALLALTGATKMRDMDHAVGLKAQREGSIRIERTIGSMKKEKVELILPQFVIPEDKTENDPSKLDNQLLGFLPAAPALLRARRKETEDEAKKAEEEKEKEKEDSAANKLPVLRYRRIHQVQQGETLVSIAESKLKDGNLAWLIADINAERLTERKVDGKRVVEVLHGQHIELPLHHEIVAYYKRDEKEADPDNLVTIIVEPEFDKDRIEQHLNEVLGLARSST